MGKVKVLNAFSLNMLPSDLQRCYLLVREVSLEEAKKVMEERGYESYISHESTSRVLSSLTGMEVPFNRQNVVLNEGDEAIIFQISVRPKEGQVFSEEEMKEIAQKKLYRFLLVKVLGGKCDGEN